MKSKNASLWETTVVALQSLRASKLRSFLTLLGIILSTTTLISVMGVIHGMDQYIATTASGLGSEGFRVTRFSFVGNFDPEKFLEYQRKNPNLTLDEFAYLRPRVRLSKEMAVAAQRGGNVTYGDDTIEATFLGNESNGAVMTNTEVAAGRYFSDAEIRRKASVAFIGADVAERFFPNVDPVGKTIQLDGRPFEVVGVGAPKGDTFGQSQDIYVSIPIDTYLKMYGRRSTITYNFIAEDAEHLTQAQDEVRVLLRNHRKLLPGTEDNFSMISSDTLSNTFNRLTGTIQYAAIGIVSVFMIVGGVVIMNIMLAVVTERTREIGIRKSVGARRIDIMNQFLMESSTLSLTGGLIGVATSWTITLLVTRLTAIPMSMPLDGIAIGLILSTAVGLFFGIYPARQASRLDPIVALRSEN